MRMSVLKITTFILLCIPVNLYAGVYKWVDAKGNVTYSSKPPPTGAKQQKIETIRSLGSAPAPQRTYSQSNLILRNNPINRKIIVVKHTVNLSNKRVLLNKKLKDKLY